MKSVGLFFIAVVVTIGYAQAPDTLWAKTYGGAATDCGYSVQQTTDGGYIVAGLTGSFGAGSHDVYLIKTDANGSAQWTRTYGGANGECGWSVQQTTDGGYIVAGCTSSFGAGSYDVYLIKTDANGDTVWTKTYGGIYEETGHSVQQTADGGYVVAGHTFSFAAGYNDIYLIKTDANGDTLWTKTYGGTSYDYGWSVSQTTDGGYVVAGHTSSFGAGSYDVYLIKTNANGDALWTRTYGGPYGDESYSVQQTADGGYIIAGRKQVFWYALSNDVCLIKTDADGNLLWQRVYGDTAVDVGRSVQQTTDGGYIVAGRITLYGAGFYDFYVIRTDANGDTIWSKTYGGVNIERGWSVRQTMDGGYIVAGFTYSFGAGDSDVWLLRLEPDVSVEEQPLVEPVEKHENLAATILSGPLQLPEGKKCRVYDITGREVESDRITHGIYFIEVDDEIVQKVIRVR